MFKNILSFSLTLFLCLNSLYAFSDCGNCSVSLNNPFIAAVSPFDPLTVMLNTGGASIAGSDCVNLDHDDISQVWSYGDNTTGTSVLHTYPQPGTYQVCVTYYIQVNNTAPCTETTCSLLQVGTLSEDCDACDLSVTSPSVSLTSPFNPLTVVFTSGTSINASQCQAVSQILSYGDGQTGTSSIHTYSKAGTYQVCLTYNAETNGSGVPCSEIACSSIQIGTGKNNISTIEANATISNYPNPCTTSTIIEYQLAEDQNVSLMVYDKSGRLVKALVQNEKQTKGNYKQNFNTEQLPAGMYFYQLLTDTEQLSGKIVKTATH
ncbi:MAG: T9SS type A sorting domain-containing protein [Chitinophagales bacterium]